jgi:hypothetical protein
MTLDDATKYRHLRDLAFNAQGQPCDDEGYPLVICDDCGKLSLDDNTDECRNWDCSINAGLQ